MGARYTEAKKASNQKWDAENLWRKSIAIPAAQKDRILEHCARRQESVNHFINRAIMEQISRDEEAAAMQ